MASSSYTRSTQLTKAGNDTYYGQRRYSTVQPTTVQHVELTIYDSPPLTGERELAFDRWPPLTGHVDRKDGEGGDLRGGTSDLCPPRIFIVHHQDCQTGPPFKVLSEAPYFLGLKPVGMRANHHICEWDIDNLFLPFCMTSPRLEPGTSGMHARGAVTVHCRLDMTRWNLRKEEEEV
jgi:hypothetical protein